MTARTTVCEFKSHGWSVIFWGHILAITSPPKRLNCAFYDFWQSYFLLIWTIWVKVPNSWCLHGYRRTACHFVLRRAGIVFTWDWIVPGSICRMTNSIVSEHFYSTINRMRLNHIKAEMKSINTGTYYSRPWWHLVQEQEPKRSPVQFQILRTLYSEWNCFLELFLRS